MSYEMANTMPVAPQEAPPGFRAELPAEVVKSAARTIQILEFFDHVRRDVSISEIAHALNYPQSSTSALLRSMVAMGYLQHNRIERTYRLTRRTGLLGAWMDPSLIRQGAIVNLVQTLARHAGETVLLTRLNEMRAQVIYVADFGPERNVSVGCQHDLARSAAGAALLSMQDEMQIRRMLVRLNAERAPDQPVVDIPAKLIEIAEGRRQGSFVGAGSAAGLAAVAAQVRHGTAGDSLVLVIEGAETRIKTRAPELARMIRAGILNLSSI
ncbi:helix-turn-helix domain-containing protein [Pseudooceanicola sp.]|uniref:IclR family transcriptional regulator n=1 Tax=Pseudooceanicola sp. TaxID=1914328 RepID=UPI002620DAA4|nr:helix-turn-helix domain-containing protein [Pseudooceanicola sp.]MDF1857158.1 helix-turn-helix domain-containing protein [Pseudooceanicola sp.]